MTKDTKLILVIRSRETKANKKHSIRKITARSYKLTFKAFSNLSQFTKEKIKEKKENAKNQRELLNNMSNEYQNGTGLEQQVR